MYAAPGGSHGPASPFPPVFDPTNGPEAVIAAALAAAQATQEAAKRAEQAAAAALAGTGLRQMPAWATPTAGIGGFASPKFAPPPSERPPGFLKASSPSKALASKSEKDSSGKPELPAKSLRHDTEDLSTIEEDDDATSLPTKSRSLPNFGDSESPATDGPSLGSSEHGTGICTPCAWFHKPDGCLNAKDCRYCHLCPEGELKKRKKQKVARMRLGLVTPKAGGGSPSAQPLNLAALLI